MSKRIFIDISDSLYSRLLHAVEHYPGPTYGMKSFLVRAGIDVICSTLENNSYRAKRILSNLSQREPEKT